MPKSVRVRPNKTHTAVVTLEGGIRGHRKIVHADGPFEVSDHVLKAFPHTLMESSERPQFTTVPQVNRTPTAAPIVKEEVEGYEHLAEPVEPTAEDKAAGEQFADGLLKSIVDKGKTAAETASGN